MNRLRKGSESLHLPIGLTPSGRGRLYKTGLFSLLLHLSADLLPDPQLDARLTAGAAAPFIG